MKKPFSIIPSLVLALLALPISGLPQESNPPKEKAPQAAQAPPGKQQAPPEQAPQQAPVRTPEQERTVTEAGGPGAPQPNLRWDMTEVAPIQTRHQITVNGKTMNYTATAGRLPIKDPTGKIEAEMFFVAYILDGIEPNHRPLTFAFNGGPGSASLWLHMGALGPRRWCCNPKDGCLQRRTG